MWQVFSFIYRSTVQNLALEKVGGDHRRRGPCCTHIPAGGRTGVAGGHRLPERLSPKAKGTCLVIAQHPYPTLVNRPPRPLATREIRHWLCGGRASVALFYVEFQSHPRSSFFISLPPFSPNPTCLCIPQPMDLHLRAPRAEPAPSCPARKGDCSSRLL